MTLKIEKNSDRQKTTIWLIGHIQSEHIEELKAQMQGNESGIVLDLSEVTLVAVEVVRFLYAEHTKFWLCRDSRAHSARYSYRNFQILV